jgi:hypothetical protein
MGRLNKGANKMSTVKQLEEASAALDQVVAGAATAREEMLAFLHQATQDVIAQTLAEHGVTAEELVRWRRFFGYHIPEVMRAKVL